MQRNTGANAKGAKVTQKSQKGMPKIIWEMLEPVFMRVAGHKWLGRRMGLVVDVCGFCGLAWAGMNVGTVAEGVKTSKVGCNMR